MFFGTDIRYCVWRRRTRASQLTQGDCGIEKERGVNATITCSYYAIGPAPQERALLSNLSKPSQSCSVIECYPVGLLSVPRLLSPGCTSTLCSMQYFPWWKRCSAPRSQTARSEYFIKTLWFEFFFRHGKPGVAKNTDGYLNALVPVW